MKISTVKQEVTMITHTTQNSRTGMRGGEGQYTGNWEERKAGTARALVAV